MDSPLRSTVYEILTGIFKFRILVVGKSGCGKSTLLSKVFGIDLNQEEEDLAERRKYAISPKIRGGLVFRGNNEFVLYTSSPDFLPNSDTDFDEIRQFIYMRLHLEDMKQRVHAIWICMDTPLGGERISESGIERVLDVAHKSVPIIVVLTKFDQLVDSVLITKKISDVGDDEINDARETADRLLDDTLKKVSLDSLLSQQLVTPVSALAGFEDTISTLIQFTDSAVQRFNGKRAHDSSITLAWAIAQRQDLETKVAATIDVGGKRFWSALSNATEFRGRTMEQCVSIIHKDIVSIWNIQDSFSYLEGEDFKARMSHLVEELINTHQNDTRIPTTPGSTATFAAATADPIVAIGAVAEAAKWVFDVYQTSPNSIACIMEYIVDLIMVLIFLSEIHQFQEIVLHGVEEDAVNAIKAYIASGLLSEVHKEIRKFVTTDKWYEMTNQKDPVLEEIIRLVKKFHPRARASVKKSSQRVPSPTIPVTTLNESFELYAREGSIQSRRALSLKPSIVLRRAAQEAPPDILTIVEEATKAQTPRSSSEDGQRPALLIPETSPAESSKHSPLNPLNWIRRDRPGSDEEVGKTRP